MPDTILVTYASRYGSTQGVAEAIAAQLREVGRSVELRPMREVQSLEGYSAVVLGSPLYIGKLLKDAHQFLAKHQTALAQRPVALFTLGPLSTKEGEMRGTIAQRDKELANYPWLKPVAMEMFVGKYDPARLNLLFRLLASLPASPLHGLTASDRRDWAAIRAWASTLPTKLH